MGNSWWFNGCKYINDYEIIILILDSLLKIKILSMVKLWDEKYITQHICGLFGDYYNITYEDFINKIQTNKDTMNMLFDYIMRIESHYFDFEKKKNIVDNYWNTL